MSSLLFHEDDDRIASMYGWDDFKPKRDKWYKVYRRKFKSHYRKQRKKYKIFGIPVGILISGVIAYYFIKK
jgi:hypothetical protein